MHFSNSDVDMDLNDQSRGKSGLHFIFYQVLVHDPEIFTWGLRGSNRIQFFSYNYRISKINFTILRDIIFFLRKAGWFESPLFVSG